MPFVNLENDLELYYEDVGMGESGHLYSRCLDE